MQKLFTIPFGVPFLHRFAQGLAPLISEGAEGYILLPNHRACRTLGRHLYDKTGAVLLPHMLPVGECHGWPEFQACVARGHRLPTVMPRMALLGALLERVREESRWQISVGEINQFLDVYEESIVQDVNLDALHQVVPEMFAFHWQESLHRLAFLRDQVEDILQRHQAVSEPAYQRWFLDRLCHLWKTTPPQVPVIIAGSTGSRPLTSQLMACVKDLPTGMIVFPGFDSYYEASTESADVLWHHPQTIMRQHLQAWGIPPNSVKLWGEEHGDEGTQKRQQEAKAFSVAVFDSPTAGVAFPAELTKQIESAECEDEGEELQLLQALVVDSLATPDHTVAVVMSRPAQIQKFLLMLSQDGIHPEVSSGLPLEVHPLSQLCLRLLKAANRGGASGWKSLDTLDVMKHPAVAPHVLDVNDWEQQCLDLEMSLLRRYPISPHWFQNLPHRRGGMEWFYNAVSPWGYMTPHTYKPLQLWIEELESILSALTGPLTEKETTPIGIATSSFNYTNVFNVLKETLTSPIITLMQFAEIFTGALRKLSWPTPVNTQRVVILGPFELRLHAFSRVIVADMNAGQWPRTQGDQGLLSEFLRQALGFFPAARGQGQSAYDLMQALASDALIFTRSKRVEGNLTQRSPWLARLDLGLPQGGGEVRSRLEDVRRTLSQAQKEKASSGARHRSSANPSPPVHLRPRRLSATRIEVLHQNPYEFYARDILQLLPLLPFGDQMPPWQWGTVIHKNLEQFMRGYPQQKDAASMVELLKTALKEGIRQLPSLGQQHIMAGRFDAIASAFVEDLLSNEQPLSFLTEAKGEATLETSQGPISIIAKADRLDCYSTGAVGIVDYKTGLIPALKDIQSFKAMQLLVEAWLVQKGGFQELGVAHHVQNITYVQFKGGHEGFKALRLESDKVIPLMAHFDLYFRQMMEVYGHPDFSFSFRPQGRAGYDPYAHLARFQS